jgi:CheY-like chemotaxis protein
MDSTSPTLRVLIVEDNSDAAVSLAKLLRKLGGFDVSFTTSSAQAIADTLLRTPNVVISDIGLPMMDGCELAGELISLIKERTGSRPLLIALSGMGDAQERCATAGFDHFFQKPVSPAALVKLLRNYADEIALRRKAETANST